MRLVDIVLAIPFILLALVFMTVFGPSLAQRDHRLRRRTLGAVYAHRLRPRARAARARIRPGLHQLPALTTTDILLRHILINIAGPLLVVATLELGFVILIESGLSFLGLGTPPEIPSWGGMLQEGRALINIAWWLTTFPGLAIMLTVVGFNFIGDWLRDRFDPRTGLAGEVAAGARD